MRPVAEADAPNGWAGLVGRFLVPLLIGGGLLLLFTRAIGGGGGQGGPGPLGGGGGPFGGQNPFNFGKSQSRFSETPNTGVTFKDVAVRALFLPEGLF